MASGGRRYRTPYGANNCVFYQLDGCIIHLFGKARNNLCQIRSAEKLAKINQQKKLAKTSATWQQFPTISGLKYPKIHRIQDRPQQWIVAIPSLDQWLQTIENHRHSIGTNGCHTKKPLPFHWFQWMLSKPFIQWQW